MSLLVLKSQTLKFKPINASGKGWYNLGVRIYSLHISPSSSPSAQSWMKSHACPSLITVPFQQLKEPSRAIFEREPAPREKEKNNKNTLDNQIVFHSILHNTERLNTLWSLLNSILTWFFFINLFNLVKCLMVHLKENFISPSLSGAIIWKADLTSRGLAACFGTSQEQHNTNDRLLIVCEFTAALTVLKADILSV